jgi:hypothetical protein
MVRLVLQSINLLEPRTERSLSITNASEWNADPSRPPAPNYFRLLYLGRMLLDPEVLAGQSLIAPGFTFPNLN